MLRRSLTALLMIFLLAAPLAAQERFRRFGAWKGLGCSTRRHTSWRY